MNFNNLKIPKYQHIQAHISRLTGVFQDSLQDLTEHMNSGPPKQILNLALDVMRPYLRSLGLRVSQLSFQDIEVVIPAKPLSQDSQEQLDEGAVISAALFAFRRLWRKNAPRGSFHVDVLNFEFERLQPLSAPLFVRGHLPVSQREAIYVELSEHQRSVHEAGLQVYDEENQVVAKILVKSVLRMEKVLSSRADSLSE